MGLSCSAFGRVLTDLDGDGLPELIFSNGWSNNQTPNLWAGHVFTQKFTDSVTLANMPYCTAGTCFPTDIAGLYGGYVNNMFRVGDEIRLGAIYYTQPTAGSPSTTRWWGYDLAGQPNATSPSTANTLWQGTTDIDADGVPDNSSDVATLGLFDVNGDGYPDRVSASGTALQVELWDPAQKKLVVNAGSTIPVSATAMTVQTAWDIDGTGRLAVISTDAGNNVYCHKLGASTWRKDAVLPPHLPAYLRTYQWDNYEPNEGTDTNNDGVPDEVVRVPSALTAKGGDFYGYLSSVNDKDYYLVHTAFSGQICLTSPKVASYTLKVYSLADKLAPAGPDGLVWQDTSTAKTKCFSGSLLTPARTSEFKFIIGVESQGTASPYWPYWISAPK